MKIILTNSNLVFATNKDAGYDYVIDGVCENVAEYRAITPSPDYPLDIVGRNGNGVHVTSATTQAAYLTSVGTYKVHGVPLVYTKASSGWSVGGGESIELESGKVYNYDSSTGAITEGTSANYSGARIPVSRGDVIYFKGAGATNARLLVFKGDTITYAYGLGYNTATDNYLNGCGQTYRAPEDGYVYVNLANSTAHDLKIARW